MTEADLRAEALVEQFYTRAEESPDGIAMFCSGNGGREWLKKHVADALTAFAAAHGREVRLADFGEQSYVHEGVTLTCKNVVPGKSMHDIQQAFAAGVDEAEPGDEYAGNPSKWPTMRGLRAVVTLINEAYAAAIRASEAEQAGEQPKEPDL